MQGRPKGSTKVPRVATHSPDPKRTERAVTFLTRPERQALARTALVRKMTVSDVLRSLVRTLTGASDPRPDLSVEPIDPDNDHGLKCKCDTCFAEGQLK